MTGPTVPHWIVQIEDMVCLWRRIFIRVFVSNPTVTNWNVAVLPVGHRPVEEVVETAIT